MTTQGEARRLFLGDPGKPVPEVDAVDVKAVWQLSKETQERHPGQQVAVGYDLTKSYCSLGADVRAVCYRATFLGMMMHAQEFADLFKDGYPTQALLQAIATVQMEWMAPGVERRGPPFSVDELMQRIKDFDATA